MALFSQIQNVEQINTFLQIITTWYPSETLMILIAIIYKCLYRSYHSVSYDIPNKIKTRPLCTLPSCVLKRGTCSWIPCYILDKKIFVPYESRRCAFQGNLSDYTYCHRKYMQMLHPFSIQFFSVDDYWTIACALISNKTKPIVKTKKYVHTYIHMHIKNIQNSACISSFNNMK